MNSQSTLRRSTSRLGIVLAAGRAIRSGLQLTFILDNEAHTATSQVNLTRLHEGAPGYIHGGIIADADG